jgi:hypothetical protein
MPTREIYQLKVTVQGIRPAIWRRLQVPSDFRLCDLHHVLQLAFDWEEAHLHAFSVGRRGGELDEHLRLHQVASVKSRFVYEYDFGDGWVHDILVEKVLPADPAAAYPRCIAGKRAAPPEDSGGPWGYAEKLWILAKPKHEEHEDIKEWLGEDFDPEAFDVAATDELLRPRKRRRAQSSAA